MGSLLLAVLLVGLVFLGVSLRKTYGHLPVKELRRRARRGDEFASVVYRLSSYGIGLGLILWLIIGIAGGLLFLVLASSLPGWLALLIAATVIWLAFAWLPNGGVSTPARRVAIIVAPVFSSLLGWLQPLTSRLEIFMKKYSRIQVHTGLYEREDLLEILDRQAGQVDNRISEDELRIARGALLFGERMVRDIMTPRRMIKMLLPDAVISPHLMDELHGTGFSRFPVMQRQEDNSERVIGTLFLKDLVKHPTSGHIRDIMQADVYYVNENSSLMAALSAFLKTKHHLFIVVNNFEEIVGVLSIEDVLEQVLGTKIIDEFDAHDDLRVVASLQAEADRKQNAEKVVE